jgi:hypothetical protein
MPTSERRYYLGLLIQQKHKEQEHFENSKKQSSGSKGSRTSSISGDALKSKLKSGEIPI